MEAGREDGAYIIPQTGKSRPTRQKWSTRWILAGLVWVVLGVAVRVGHRATGYV